MTDCVALKPSVACGSPCCIGMPISEQPLLPAECAEWAAVEKEGLLSKDSPATSVSDSRTPLESAKGGNPAASAGSLISSSPKSKPAGMPQTVLHSTVRHHSITLLSAGQRG